MRIETSMFAKQHMDYIKTAPAEMCEFDTIFDHMYFYLISVVGLIPSTAKDIVDDFKSDLLAQPDLN